MAKDKITEYDATAANNTVVGDVNLAENSSLPSDMNNAVREVMSHQKEAFGSGTPLYVDQTNNRVGIGTTSPDRSFHITSSEPSVVLENSGQGTDLKTWRIYSNSSSLQVGTVDDAFAAGQNALEITRDNTDNITGIQFKTGSSSEIARFTTDGLTFNGDTSAANALDDYEEGTWTPALTSLTVSGKHQDWQVCYLTESLKVATTPRIALFKLQVFLFTIADRIANTSHEGQGAVSGHNNNDSGKQAGSCIARSQTIRYREFHHGVSHEYFVRYIHP